jgi:YHS domain-containing protein
VLKRLLSSAVFALILFSFAIALAGETEKGKVECPVCGYLMDEDKALSHEYEGATYYFCEPGCKAYFLMNPEEMTSGKAYDAVCGMSFEKAKGVSGVHNGRMVYFCSEDCKGKYFADPAQYEINYDVAAGQVMPVRLMKHRVEFEGRPYYFVSDESRAKFEKDPGAYVYEACPIGGHVFLRKDAAGKREYQGKTYYFGCKGCLEKFDEDADKYMSQKGSLECQKPCKDVEKHEGCPLKKGAKSST